MIRQVITGIKLSFSHGKELSILLNKIREENRIKEYEANKHRLKLCYKHRQERNRSQFSSAKCDYCKLLKKV